MTRVLELIAASRSRAPLAPALGCPGGPFLNRGGEKFSPLEIETVLMQHEAVADAAAFAVPHPTLGQDVAVAVVTRAGRQVEEHLLRSWLQSQLAEVKVPRQVFVMETLRRGPTGKLQRRELAQTVHDLTANRPVAPRTATEHALARIWCDVLKLDSVGVFDNFIGVGGDSLKIVMVADQARRQGLRVTAADLFRHLTIAACAALHDGRTPERRAMGAGSRERAASTQLASSVDRYPLTPHQLVLVRARRSAQVPRELLFLTELDVKGELDPPRLYQAWCATVQAHPILRTSFEGTMQTVSSAADLDWDYLDVSPVPGARRDAQARAFVDAALDMGMNDARAPLVRVRLVRKEAGRFVLATIWHHAIMDLWVAVRILREVFSRHADVADRHGNGEQASARPFRD
jgi:aryl carrier-like protein